MGLMIITGASSGMGKEFALQLDKLYEFSEIWLIARRIDKLQEVALKLRNKTKILALDLTKESDLNKYQEMINSYSGNVDYLVNSAGFGRFGNYEEVDWQTSLQMIDINIKALVFVTMNTLPKMSRGSRIINLGSASSFFPLINFNVYASSKAFVVHYSNALHDELKSRGITVTVVCPGWVRTEFFDVALNSEKIHSPKRFKPMLEPEVVVQKAIKAVNKGRKFFVFNYYTKIHRYGARFLPRAFMLKQWKNMQKK